MIELVGIAFATVPFGKVDFATLSHAFAGICEPDPFAAIAVISGVAVEGNDEVSYRE